MWIDDGSHIYPGEKPQKSIDRKLKQQQEQSSINLVEPNFTMATVIKIGPLEGKSFTERNTLTLFSKQGNSIDEI